MLPVSCIGHRVAEEVYDPSMSAQASCLKKLGAVLHKAVYSQLFFRRLEHYLIALENWALAAIGTKQRSVTAQVAHRNLILQLIEDETRLEGWRGFFIGILYCELRRKGWAARTRKLEKSLLRLEQL